MNAPLIWTYRQVVLLNEAQAWKDWGGRGTYSTLGEVAMPSYEQVRPALNKAITHCFPRCSLLVGAAILN